MKKIPLTLLLLALLTSVIVSVEANPGQQKAKGQQFPPPFLEGNRIEFIHSTLTIPVDEPCYVIHGWGTLSTPWKEFQPEWKPILLRESSFSLSINGEPIPVRKWIHHYREFLGYEDVMLVQYYVQIEANTFEADVEYAFQGTWTQEGSVVYVHDMTVTFQ